MKTLDIIIELLTDVSVPESSRSLGGAKSLDYVPGRAMWGALATAAFHAGMSEQEGLRLLRGGAIRVLDAVPSFGSERTYPTPRSWHRPKYGATGEVLCFCDDDTRTGVTGQHQPLETRWRSPEGEVVEVERRYSLRTSVTATGRAGEGLLFGIDAIPAGTLLSARVVGEPADLEWAANYLGDAEIRLGRSKSAELGIARCSSSEKVSPGLDLVEGDTTRVSFLCCSRLSLRDPATGAPTFRPDPLAFGLPDSWRLLPEASFVRTSRFSPYNSQWRRPELERHVIEKGSVITFVGHEAVSLDDVRESTSRGVGIWRDEGLGEVVAHPRWLVDPRIEFPRNGVARRSGRQEQEPAPQPEDELFAWARSKERQRHEAREAFLWARKEAKGFERYGLNPSQWGVIHGLAREARHRSNADAWLRDSIERAVGTGVSSLSRGWGAGEKAEKAGERLLKLVGGLSGDLPTRIELLAGCGLRLKKGDQR